MQGLFPELLLRYDPQAYQVTNVGQRQLGQLRGTTLRLRVLSSGCQHFLERSPLLNDLYYRPVRSGIVWGP